MGAIIVLFVGLLGVVLGYFIGKSSTDSSTTLDAYRKKTDSLSAEIEVLRAQIASGGHTLGFSVLPSAPEPFNAELASSVLGKKVEEDDLKVIEGVGNKIEYLFKSSGILTWKSFAETSVDRCNEILNKAGEQFAFHNPSTWPRQARLAYEGKWRDLKIWQDSLQGGLE
jgi:hypothetical protein